MRHALYHPTEGYYSNSIQQVGNSGDFSTSATLSPSLAKNISAWVQAEIKRQPFSQIHIIEIGAGNGSLMAALHASLPFFLRRKCTFHIVEISQALQQIQQNVLRKLKVHWHHNVADALELSRGEALIYSNELVDAFPVRIFRKRATGFQELYIDSQARSEQFDDISTDDLPKSDFFSSPMKSGTRFEVHESYQQWLSQWADKLCLGSILTIDYGDRSEQLLQNNPTGSLRGYWKHQRITGPSLYQNVGHQDLTTDVNFTDLMHWGKKHDWQNITLENQQSFLQRRSDSPEDTFLSDNEGAGSAFQVLHQRCNR